MKTARVAPSFVALMYGPARLSLVVLLLGCSQLSCQDEREASLEARLPAAPNERPRLMVFAASSLTDAFDALASRFEAAHPDVDIVPSYGGSQVLKLQISEGAPADVFASADEAHLRELLEAGLAEPARTFAENELVLVVPKDNPARVGALAELPRAERVVIGTPSVPVGAYTRALLERARARYGAEFEREVLAQVVSQESNVRLVRAKVELGEADAAIVYRTDAAGSRELEAIALPPELNVRARYPMAVLRRTSEPDLAQRWMDFVLSPEGQALLGAHGFLGAR